VVIYPSSGTGAWEAAIVNTLSPGDTVLMAETGHFATLWKNIATRFGIEVEFIPGDWRRGADPAAIEARLTEDKARKIKAVMVVHNETSTGATSRVAEIRKAIDARRPSALFMVDTISRSPRSTIAMTNGGSTSPSRARRRGLMLPPGLGFNAVSEKALAASKSNTLPRSFWDWEDMIKINAGGFFPYTPATNLLYGLKEALAMLQEEGLDQVFARHKRLASACRAAVRAWGLELLCENPTEQSPVLTGVLMPPSHDADRFRKITLGEVQHLARLRPRQGRRARSSASAISASATSSLCSAPSPASRWASPQRACPIAAAASRQRWPISKAPKLATRPRPWPELQTEVTISHRHARPCGEHPRLERRISGGKAWMVGTSPTMTGAAA
jgi:aspartate aminotransferase-like enzyme